MRIYLSCYFQEIWDFRLEFEDLKGFNTIDSSRKPIASYLSLSLLDGSKSTALNTKPANSTLNPVWGDAETFLHYRGTLDDLTDLLL